MINNYLRILISLVILLCFPGQGSAAAQPGTTGAKPGTTTVYVIGVAGDVEPGMAAFVSRAFRDTAEAKDAIFVMEIDTFGGRVDSALRIVDSLLDEAPGKTIAFVKTKALSAGALIALACNELVMRPNSTIGDCAPIAFAEEGPKMLGEKFQSPLRAKFRTLARRNGYPASLAEAMVSPELEVFEVVIGEERVYLDAGELAELTPEQLAKIVSKKVVVAKGELLTMDDAEARELNFSRLSAGTVEEMVQRLNIGSYRIVRIEPSWSETLGTFISTIAPILLMIGLVGVYTELKTPGFGIPGILGLTCLGLVFFNQYIMGMADYTELLLIVVGIILLGFEIFVIPGFGVAGIAGFLCLVLGMILAFQDFILPTPEMPWQKHLFINNIIRVLGSAVVAFVGSLAMVRYVLPRFSLEGEGPYLDTSLKESHVDVLARQQVQVGDQGRVLTALRPSGKVRFPRVIVDVVSEGEFIERGAMVEISDIQGNRVVVRRLVA